MASLARDDAGLDLDPKNLAGKTDRLLVGEKEMSETDDGEGKRGAGKMGEALKGKSKGGDHRVESPTLNEGP